MYIYITAIGRRSVNEESTLIKKQRPTSKPEPLPVDPIPFHLIKHGTRYRYRRQSSDVNCQPDGTRHVLFILDTSGSIGRTDFNRMTSALSTLVHHFCRPTKFAVMTFSHEHFIEFCFNCFNNDCNGRDDARDAMRNVRYRGGMTHTGEATQCACDSLLTSRCAFPDMTSFNGPGAVCLDVIYITDGHSNGPQNVCEKVQCLYDFELDERGNANNLFHLNVFAIGIDNYDITELNCITRTLGPVNNYTNRKNTAFTFQNFTLFEMAINGIGQSFDNPINDQTCFAIHSITGTDTDDCSKSN